MQQLRAVNPPTAWLMMNKKFHATFISECRLLNYFQTRAGLLSRLVEFFTSAWEGVQVGKLLQRLSQTSPKLSTGILHKRAPQVLRMQLTTTCMDDGGYFDKNSEC